MPRGTISPKHREAGSAQPKARTGRGSRQASTPATRLPMLRTSERSALKRCEFLWDLTYNQRIKPLTDMPALRFGSLVHKALADFYIVGKKRGVHPAKAYKKHYDADMKRNREIFGVKLEENEKWTNAEELGVAMLENYVDEYGADSNYEVLATEHPFRTIVYHPESYDPNYPPEAQATAKPWFVYTGVLDGVWRHVKTREIWIPDHKTTKGIGGTPQHPNFPVHLRIDDQAGAYWSWGLDYLILEGFLKKHEINGMLYNFLRKAMPDERPSKMIGGFRQYLNQNGTVSLKQPSPYFARMPIHRDEADREEARRRAQVDFRRIELLRSGELETSKSPGMFSCPGCPMLDACELHETGHDHISFLNQTTQRWDPYAEHEVYDGR